MYRSNKYGRGIATGALMLLGAVVAGNALAADEIIPFGKETGQINLGLFRPTMDTKLSESAKGGTTLPTISGESLGLDQNLSAGRIDGFWRFADRHRLWGGYYRLDRNATGTLKSNVGPVNIPTNGTTDTLLAGSNVSISSKWDLYMLGYGYSFYKTESWEVAAAVGLNVARLKSSMNGTFVTAANGTFSGSTASTNVAVPLPVLGIAVDWGINERWRAKGKLGGLQVNFSDVKTNVSDVSASLEYRVAKNFGLGAGYSLLGAKADYSKDNSFTKLDWQIRGWQLYGSLLF